jgi:CheY-like chemotaxis protein
MTTATKILIVDDSEVDLRLIGGLLRCNPQYRMELVENGKQALERIASAPPDLVITDLIMPEMNGLELLRLLQDRHPDIPVILMTAYGNETIAVEALEAGAASYVPKARQAELLLETVERVVARVHADRNRSRLAECMGEIYWYVHAGKQPGAVATVNRRGTATAEPDRRGQRGRTDSDFRRTGRGTAKRHVPWQPGDR